MQAKEVLPKQAVIDDTCGHYSAGAQPKSHVLYMAGPTLTGKHGADCNLAFSGGRSEDHSPRCENLAEFSRTIFERCGNRSSLDVVIIWMAACRIALIQLGGTRNWSISASLQLGFVCSELRTW